MAAIELLNTPLFNDASLVSYYRLADTSDSKGSNALTNNNTVGFVSALFGNGADFGTANSNKTLRYSGGNMGIASSHAFSMVGWFKIRTDVSGTTSYSLLERIVTVSGTGNEFIIRYFSNSGTPTFQLRTGPGGVNSSTYASTLGTTNWHHLAITFDGSTAYLYLDGSQVTSVATSDGTFGGSYANLTQFTIGGLNSVDGDIWDASTYADDVAVFSRLLTSTEISNLYSGTWGIPNKQTLIQQATNRSNTY